MKQPSQTVRIIIKTVVSIAVLTGLILFVGGSCRERTKPGSVKVAAGQPIPENADFITATIQKVPSWVELAGTTASAKNVNITSRLSSHIITINVATGSRVKKGELLITLDDRELKEQERAAEVHLNQAKADYERVKMLRKENAATAQAFDAALAQFESARAGLNRLNVMLTYTRITSPIDGVIEKKLVEAGDMAAPGQLLLSVYDASHMRIELPVPVRLIGKLPIGATLPISIEYPQLTTTGTVHEIVSAIDPVTRTRMIKITIDAADSEILPGSFARVRVNDQPHDAVTIPASAITRSGQLEFIYVARDDRLHQRLVKSGYMHGTDLEILTGIEPGERVLIPGESKE